MQKWWKVKDQDKVVINARLYPGGKNGWPGFYGPKKYLTCGLELTRAKDQNQK